jgi:hypothetical protein
MTNRERIQAAARIIGSRDTMSKKVARLRELLKPQPRRAYNVRGVSADKLAYARNYYRQRKAAGICVHCGKANDRQPMGTCSKCKGGRDQ